jgi:cyclopropane-fatty-acyl-phospholipid synthase
MIGPTAGVHHAARAMVLRVLRDLPGGRIEVIDGDGTHVVGARTGACPLTATVTVHEPATYQRLLRGSRGLADAYADGWWDADDLVTVIRIAARSMAAIDGLRARAAWIGAPVRRAAASRRSNTHARSRRNVERHYDLGNEFFSLVLDETMGYSCAYWERPDMDAVEASRANLDRVCRLLDLREGERVLEMGSGWGGLAVHAAQRTGCHVSTVTLSENQRRYVEQLAHDAGVAGRVEVIVSDYRDVRGTWDKVMSLEMVESIGPQNLATFIACCAGLMRPDGLMLLQAITTHDRLFRIDRYARTFLNERIFPGGCAPSVEAILSASARTTELRCVGLYDITPHYPLTLRAWRERIQGNWTYIASLGGFDEHFLRMWTLYFSYCEAGFLERRVQDRQLLLAGPQWRDEDRLLTTAGRRAAEPAYR